MEKIRIHGEAGRLTFTPANIPQRVVERIERKLRKLISAPKGYMTATEMRSILKEKDPLIGTPGGALRAYRIREGLTQVTLAKASGIRQGHLSEMEKNKRAVGVKAAKRLATVLRCNYRQLL